MWIVKASICYLGDRDKWVDSPEEAHQFKYKKHAKDHATTYCLFHQFADGRDIPMQILPAPKKIKS